MDLCGVCYVVAVLAVLLAWLFEKKLGLVYQLFHKTEPHETLHGGSLVADVLHAHGVKYVFTLVGGHISPILVACEKKGIRVVDTRQEATAVFAADAVARLSGTVGVAAVTAGPGVTNTVTAVKNAQMAESPVLVLGGAAATLLKGRGALQDIDQLSLFKPLCKYAVTVTKVREIVPTLRTALKIAQSGTPGPVFVEFPIDTLYPYPVVMKEIGVKDAPAGAKVSVSQRLINWYLKNHVNNLFAGGWEMTNLNPLPVDIPKAPSVQVSRCADLLTRSKKPVVVIGSQATLPPVPAERLRKCLEDLGIPCFLGGMSRGLLGSHSRLQIRQKRGEALKEADLIILAGAVCDFRLSYGRSLNRRAKVISVNRDSVQLYKNSDMFWRPTEAVLGDVASFLVDLQARVGTYRCDESWLNLLKGRDESVEATNRKKSEEETPNHLNTVKVLHELEAAMSDNTIMVADGGDFVGTAAYIVRPRAPLCWLDPGAFGTLGVGGGFALGAKLCRPESDVWCIYGDGAVGYSIIEFDTYARHKTPVIAVVGNDAAWSQIARDQVPRFGSDVACMLQYTHYDDIAVGLGGKGYRLDKGDLSKLKEVFTRAQDDSRQGASVLVNVLIDKSDFREGSISV